jgi:phosphoglycolate phosphatase
VIRAVVFDFDGTLTELTLDFDHMRKDLEKLLLTYVTPDILNNLRGRFMIETIYAVEEILGQKGAAFRYDAFALLSEIEVDAANGKDLFPFTRKVLRTLHSMNVRTGIMTRNCSGAVKRMFPDYSEYVDVVVSREETRLVKPHPSHPLALLRSLDASPTEALLVGDHPTDIEAGIAACMRTVGVLTGRIGRDELTRAGADHVIDDIRGIPRIVESLYL